MSGTGSGGLDAAEDHHREESPHLLQALITSALRMQSRVNRARKAIRARSVIGGDASTVGGATLGARPGVPALAPGGASGAASSSRGSTEGASSTGGQDARPMVREGSDGEARFSSQGATDGVGRKEAARLASGKRWYSRPLGLRGCAPAALLARRLELEPPSSPSTSDGADDHVAAGAVAAAGEAAVVGGGPATAVAGRDAFDVGAADRLVPRAVAALERCFLERLGRDKTAFVVETRNLLAGDLCGPHQFPYASRTAMQWEWRRALHMQEIRFRLPSILMLQEVQSWQTPDAVALVVKDAPPKEEDAQAFKRRADDAAKEDAKKETGGGGDGSASSGAGADGGKDKGGAGADPMPVRIGNRNGRGSSEQNHERWLNGALVTIGYEGLHCRKRKAGGRPTAGRAIGPSLHWQTADWECISKHDVHLGDEAISQSEEPAKTRALFQSTLPEVAAAVVLRHRRTAHVGMAVSVHITAQYRQPHLQLMEMSACVHATVARLRASLEETDPDGQLAKGSFGRPSWPFFVIGGDFNALSSHPMHRLLSRGTVKASTSEIREGEKKGVPYPAALLSLPRLRDMVPEGWLAPGGAWHGLLSASMLDKPLSLASSVSACFGHDPVFTHHVGEFHAALDWVYCGPDPGALGLGAGRVSSSAAKPKGGRRAGSKGKAKGSGAGKEAKSREAMYRGGLLPCAALSEVPDMEIRRYKGLPSPQFPSDHLPQSVLLVLD